MMSESAGKRSSLAEMFFVQRVVATLLVLLSLGGGWVAYRSLVKENYPDLKIPFAVVQTEWPGADPESVEKRITNKIEEKIKAVPSLKSFQSASYDSYSMISVEFNADADVDVCVSNLRAEVDKVEDLPSEAKTPVVKKSSVDDVPILTLNLYGPVNAYVKNRVARELESRLQQVKGVREVTINGERDDQIFILLDNQKAQSLGVSSLMVKEALESAHRDMPLEDIESEDFAPAIRVRGRFRDLRDLGDLVVARLGTRPVELDEVATIRRDLSQRVSIIRMSYRGAEFQEALSIDVVKSSGADTVGIVNKAKEVTREFSESADWPPGLEWAISDDTSLTIIDALGEVSSSGVQAIGLVFLVLLVALTWREAIVAGLSIPVTVMAVLMVCPLLGYTMNKMVIIGLVLALGMLVDVFILMMEGMHENIFAEGLGFREAALKTIRMYAMPAFSGQLTTIFAFMPLAFIGGTSGKFIRIIPVSVSITLLLSFLVAILVSVPMSWHVFRWVLGRKEKVGKTWMDRLTDRACAWYEENVGGTVLKAKWTAWLTLGVTVAVMVLALHTAGYLKNEMFPKEDAMTLGATVELAPETTLLGADRVARALAEVFRGKEYFESVVSYTGLRSPMAPNAQLLVNEDTYLVGFGCRLLAKAEREEQLSFRLLPGLREECEKKLLELAPGATIVFHMDTGGSSNEAPVQLRLISRDMTSLRTLADRMKRRLERIPGTTDVEDNLGPGQFSVELRPNREAMNFFSISEESMGAQLRYATGTDRIALFPAEDTDDELDIRLGYLWPSRRGQPGGPMRLREVASILIHTDNGKVVTLDSLVHPVVDTSSLTVPHYGARRTVVVSCRTENRTATEIVADLEEKIAEMKEAGQWVPGCTYEIGGENEDAEETYGNMGNLLMMALFLVFSVLALQFGNFKQPLIIMSAVPLSLIGVILGFFFAGLSVSFPAVVGIVSLIGIAVNDAIVMVETMNTLHRGEGMSVRDAAVGGAARRLRPIAVTTITTVTGLIPLMISNPTWEPLCAAIIFGLLAATVISTFVTPCLYILLTPAHGAAEA